MQIVAVTTDWSHETGGIDELGSALLQVFHDLLLHYYSGERWRFSI